MRIDFVCSFQIFSQNINTNTNAIIETLYIFTVLRVNKNLTIMQFVTLLFQLQRRVLSVRFPSFFSLLFVIEVASAYIKHGKDS